MDKHRSAILFSDDDVAEVIAIFKKPERSNVDVLVADGQVVPAGVGVAVLDGGDELRQGDTQR